MYELRFEMRITASHSLSVREEPHEHIWKCRVGMSGVPKEGMIVNLPLLRSAFEQEFHFLDNTYLNSNNHISAEARQTPTCETLSAYLYSRFSTLLSNNFISTYPTLKLNWVEVALLDLNGMEWGSVRYHEQ